MNRDIYYDLVEVAKAGGTTTYQPIADIAKLDMRSPHDRELLSEILMEISVEEHKKGRPMLSAVVVHSGSDQIPGDGFFTLASELGLWDGSNKRAFFEEERQRVWDYWKSNR